MPRIPAIDDAGATPEQAAVLAAERAALGVVLEPTRVYAHVPAFAAALAGVHGALAGAGGIPERLAFLARTRVAQIHGAVF